MMSKEKILKGIDDHLVNIHCWRTDLLLDQSLPECTKKQTISELQSKYSNLLDLRSKLKELLIG